MVGQKINVVLKILSRPRNRIILQHLQDVSVTSPQDLARHITENHPDSTAVDAEVIRIQHDHLPLLADHGLIAYDQDMGTVRDESGELTDHVLRSIDKLTVANSID
ncbi:DUF7344 domain-containing protein [Natronorubrum halalkaliphilum]|uniref:DUF7344 domain-containing protein n=1 Tax=Natronorubrum halalkaliphilum TaxID=2691917 RepID=UPI003CCC06FE